MRTLASVITLLLWTAAPCFAQLIDEGPMRADVNVVVGIPEGELEGSIDGEAIGISAFLGGPVPNSPIVLGSEIGYMNYGTHSQLTLHSTVFDDGIDEQFAVPVEAVATSVSNNIVLGHFVVRLQPSTGILQPYVDGLAGVKYFDSQLRVESDVVVFRRGLSQGIHISDFALSYGAGGGLELQLHEIESRWSEGSNMISLHVGVRYLFGRTANYASGGVVRDVDDRLVVNEVESETDLIVLQFGIRIRH